MALAWSTSSFNLRVMSGHIRPHADDCIWDLYHKDPRLIACQTHVETAKAVTLQRAPPHATYL